MEETKEREQAYTYAQEVPGQYADALHKAIEDYRGPHEHPDASPYTVFSLPVEVKAFYRKSILMFHVKAGCQEMVLDSLTDLYEWIKEKTYEAYREMTTNRSRCISMFEEAKKQE